MSGGLYSDAFFARQEEGSRSSARITVPLVLRFVQPTSVVDVGCGIGTWLAEFKRQGIGDCVGIDGDYVNRSLLLIEPKEFLPRDLSQPLDIGRQFDLAISLEVAEHLPAAAADTFVASLTRVAPVVLFSAAIPHQGGDGHINEQWPEYWQQHFARHGYVVADCLRERLWNLPDVEQWYAQNILFYVRRDRMSDYPRLAEIVRASVDRDRMSVVHPGRYLATYDRLLRKLREALLN